MRNKGTVDAMQTGDQLSDQMGPATPAHTAPNYHLAAPSLAGVWHTSVKIEALPEAFYGLWSFYGDGNFLDINSLKETNPGIWMGAGDTYVLTFWGLGYDKEGKVNGRGRVRLAIKVVGADHFTAAGVTDVFDLRGEPMESEFSGPVTVEGVRMQMESS
jgi:hypothetical protein